MKIEWNKVTWYSKVAAVIIYVATFALAFYLGRVYESLHPNYTLDLNSGGHYHGTTPSIP